MKGLAKLREIAEGASPGPWKLEMALTPYDADGRYLGDFISGDIPQGERGANAQLAVLGRNLLLPAFKALEKARHKGLHSEPTCYAGCNAARAVLAQLEEALG